MTTPPPDNEYVYPGSELDLFARAVNWKRYWQSRVNQYLQGDVLEIGAGIGANALLLRSSAQSRWLCVEPDARLAARLKDQVDPYNCETLVGTSADIPENESFDTALYIDVLEHIEDDTAEVARVAPYLKSGGHLVMLGPAHNALYSPFDKHVGHVRRYNRKNLPGVDPNTYRLVHIEYLDCIGMAASLANRFLLRATLPTKAQIKTWDSRMVPLSRIIDPLLARTVGKSILAVWQKK